MAKAKSHDAKKAKHSKVTSMSLFLLASNTETTLDHLERLVKLTSEKLWNLGPAAGVEGILQQTAEAETLLDAVALYLGKIGDSVEEMYQVSRAIPKTRAEIKAMDEPDDVRKRA